MPVEPKLLADYIGLDVEALENEDALREAFDRSFVKRELAHKDKDITGKVFGSINGIMRSKLKAIGKKFEVDAKFDEIDPSEGIEAIGTAMSDRLDTLTSELSTAKKGGASTEEVKQLAADLEKYKREVEAFKKNAGEWEAKYTELHGSVTAKEAKAREDNEWSKATSSFTFRDDVNPYTRKGFEAEARSKYKLQFEEDGAVKVLGADGNILMDKAKSQTYASLGALLKADAEAAKLSGGNPQGGQPVKRTVVAGLGGPAQKQEQQVPARGMRRVMPEA